MELKLDGVRFVLQKYRAVIALGSVALLAELGYSLLNFSALPVYVREDLHAGPALGLMISAFLLTDSICRPGFGVLGDRVGRKWLLLLGPLISMFTPLLTIQFANVWVLMALRIIDGLGSAALWPTAFAVISDVVEEKNRSTAMGILNVTYMAGIALGPLMGGLANEKAAALLGLSQPHEASFYLISVLFLLSFVVGLAAFPKEAGKPHHVDLPEAEQHAFKMSDLLHSLKVVPEMLAMGFVAFLGIGLLMPILKLYAMDQFHLTETQFGAALTPGAAALAVFAIPLGRLGDKWGKEKPVCWGLLACALSMWVVASVHTLIIAAVCSIILGIGFISAFPAWLAIVSEQTIPSRRGEVLGAVMTAQGLGSIFGAAVGGYLYNSHHLSLWGIQSINLPFYGCAFLLTVAAMMSFTWVCSGKHAKKKPA